ncbi:MAG: hypothetical protein AB7K24_07255 [Gemmataceae bacterium]
MDPLSQLEELSRVLDTYHGNLVAARERLPLGAERSQLDELVNIIGGHKAKFYDAVKQAHVDADARLKSAQASCQKSVQSIEAHRTEAERAAKAAAAGKPSTDGAPGKTPAPESDPELGSMLRRELLARIAKKKRGDGDDDRDIWELDMREWDE